MRNEKNESKIQKLDSLKDCEFLTTKEASEFLKMSKSNLYKLTSNLKIPFSKPGGKLIYFKKSDLKEYLSRNNTDNLDDASNEFLSSTLKLIKS